MYRDQNGVRSILLDDDGCDCWSSLNIGHGMCFGGHSTNFGPVGQYGVDSLYDPACQVPRAGVGLILFSVFELSKLFLQRASLKNEK